MTIHNTWIESVKAEIDEQVVKGDDSKIWETFKGLSQSISSTATSPSRGSEVLKANIHLLWYILVRGTCNLSPSSFGQYHMVHTILQPREMSTLRQTAERERYGENWKEEGMGRSALTIRGYNG
jgi:hypothetical protein